MYADRHAKAGIKPGALSIAVGLNGAVLAALIFASPEILTRAPDEGMEIVNIPVPVDPPPIPEIKPDPKIKPTPDQRIFDPPPPQRPDTSDPIAPSKGDFTLPPGPSGMDGGMIGGTGTAQPPYIHPHVPVLVGARPDPRFARSFQPPYPPGEQRAEREGRVTVRVLIGVDGRVKQVEMVSAASDLFFAATRKQALEKWRFTPATRDGVPEEAWRTLSVSFVLNEDS